MLLGPLYYVSTKKFETLYELKAFKYTYTVTAQRQCRIHEHFTHELTHLLDRAMQLSRLTIVSREAKKKQAVRDEWVCYLQVAPLWNLLTL